MAILNQEEKQLSEKVIEAGNNLLQGKNPVFNGEKPIFLIFIVVICAMVLTNVLMFGFAVLSGYYGLTQIQDLKAQVSQMNTNIEYIKKNTYVTRLQSEKDLKYNQPDDSEK